MQYQAEAGFIFQQRYCSSFGVSSHTGMTYLFKQQFSHNFFLLRSTACTDVLGPVSRRRSRSSLRASSPVKPSKLLLLEQLPLLPREPSRQTTNGRFS